jgi:predicted nucleotidyltransferase
MDVSSLFKSKTRSALFSLFFSNPDSEYYLRELERMLNIPVSMIRKELIRQEEKGLFSSSRKGNLIYYRINKSYPLYDEMKSIVFKTIGIQGLLKEALNRIEGIKCAFIYGSYAKGSENANSDIDLLIIGDVDEDILLTKINRIEKAVKREINYILYFFDEFKKKRREEESFIIDILDNQKIFLIGDKNDL